MPSDISPVLFQKILALFIIGHIRITTPLIEKCKKHNVAIIVMNTALRPVFYWANAAEANFLIRKKQYAYSETDLTIARILVTNKIKNQLSLLKRSRCKDSITNKAIDICNQVLISDITNTNNITELLTIEGRIAKQYFKAYFQDYNWTGRKPRTKCDYINSTLDIGYTLLFNYIECFLRMFGFDIYVGVYHRLWFKRKSLVCDLVEPFRCIIDHTIRVGLNRKQIKEEDFEYNQGEYCLKRDKSREYSKLFFDALIKHKKEIFKYTQLYYRAFMNSKPANNYPLFEL
jgi:CRISPR-associated endonuclease Cas1